MEIKNNLDTIIGAIDEEFDKLVLSAKIFVKQYYKDQKNFSKKISDRSILGMMVRVINGSFSLEWHVNNFVKINEQWRVFSKYIRKGKGYEYNISSLTRHAKLWEVDSVANYEKGASHYRKAASLLISAKQSIFQLKKMTESGDE